MSTTTVTLPAPRHRTPRGLRIALVVVVALLGVATIAHGAWTLLDVAARHTFDRHAAYGGVRTLEVADEVGNVTLTRAPAGAPVRVTTHVTEGLVSPRPTVDRRGATLRLGATCPTWLVQECRVRYSIAVPAGTRLLVDASSGDLFVRDYRSRTPLDLDTSGGDIHLDGVSVPSLKLESSAGDIRAEGVRAPEIDARSSAGDVTLEAATAPRSLTAESSAGDLNLTVPDVPYRVKASSSAGEVSDSSIRQDPHAPRRIDATSSAGDVRIETGR
jgi:Putative adhesin